MARDPVPVCFKDQLPSFFSMSEKREISSFDLRAFLVSMPFSLARSCVSFFSMFEAEFFVASGFLSFSSAYAKKCVFISELCLLSCYEMRKNVVKVA